MNFLALLLVAGIENISSWRQSIQRDGLWLRLFQRCATESESSPRAWLELAIVVVLPALLLGLLLGWIEHWLFGLLTLGVHVLVLFYSLGRDGVKAGLGAFRDACRRGDQESAYLIAQRDLGVQASDEQGVALGVQRALVWQAFEGFFAVVFWYVLLGPELALAYRLLALTTENAPSGALRRLSLQWRHALDWLPARALGLTFGLVGNFAAISQSLLNRLLAWGIEAADLVAGVGRAAVDDATATLDDQGNANLDLLWRLIVRSVIFWYALLALWVVFG